MDYEIKLLEKDAIKSCNSDKDAKTLISDNNLILASAFAMLTPEKNILDKWNINYFNKDTDELTNFLVTENEVKFMETSKRIHATEIKKINTNNIKHSINDTLTSAIEKSKSEFPYETNKIFITLHHNTEYKNECWTITLFSNNMFLYKIKIDAITGETINKEVKHLLNG